MCAPGYIPPIWNQADPAFSFAGRMKDPKGMSAEQLQGLIELATKGMDEDSFLVRALRRGIAIHHSACRLKYRQVVEILFRCGYLRVIIATGNNSSSNNNINLLLLLP